MSAQRVDGDAGAVPHLTEGPGRVGVVPHEGGHVEGGREAGARRWRRISLNRALVSSAVPKPANIRIVHSRDR